MISNSKNVCRCCGSSALLVLSQVMGGSLRNVERAVLLDWASVRTPIRLRDLSRPDSEPVAA